MKRKPGDICVVKDTENTAKWCVNGLTVEVQYELDGCPRFKEYMCLSIDEGDAPVFIWEDELYFTGISTADRSEK